MTDLSETLREAYEARGYDVGDVSRNRDRYRVELLEERVDAADAREIARDAVDADPLLGLDVSTESTDDQGGVRTVVSFRHRG